MSYDCLPDRKGRYPYSGKLNPERFECEECGSDRCKEYPVGLGFVDCVCESCGHKQREYKGD